MSARTSSRSKASSASDGSLMNMHLVRHVFADKTVSLFRRGVDSRWLYHGVLRGSVTGFNPLTAQLFYGTNSHVEKWLRNRHGDARELNQEDKLVGELMFVVHDYFHLWAYHWLHALTPKLGFSVKKITPSNIEDFVFCHLITEAAATVGLDYWFLSTVAFNDICDIGTQFDELTVSYREEYEPEYRRFHKKFTAQRPSFFRDIATFYCTGRFMGFDKNDVARSPRLQAWLSHELGYGVLQRQYARQWYAYLSRETITYTDEQARKPVRCSKPWQRKLMTQFGELLWDKVKNDNLNVSPKPMPKGRTWTAPTKKQLDCRFVNLNRIDLRRDRDRIKVDDELSFRFFYRQFVARYDFAKTPFELMNLNKTLIELRDIGLVETVFRGLERLRKPAREPRDVFFPN